LPRGSAAIAPADFRSIRKEVLEKHRGADPAPVLPEPPEKGVTLGLV